MRSKFFILIFLLSNIQFYASEIDPFKAVNVFSQNSKNCASIALIKAAMLRYGYDKVIQYEKHADVYNVILRDGSHLNISQEELELAKKFARFEINKVLSEHDINEVMLHAHLLYACIAKKVQLEGYYGCEEDDGSYHKYKPVKKYSKALRFISRTSICTDKCYVLLGLNIKGKINDYTDTTVLNEDGTILYSKGHAVAAYQGKIDCYGDWITVSTEQTCSQKFNWYIVLE